MKKKSLIENNPYLKDPVKYEAALVRAVASSSAIEGLRCKGMEGTALHAGGFAVMKAAPPRRPAKSKKAKP